MLAKIIIPYFGPLPWWINFFLLSCKYNKGISWTIFTDSSTEGLICPDNVCFNKTNFSDYKKLVASRLRIDFTPENPVKLCDVKPFLGFIHPEEINGFKYWGFSDIDVIYGDIADYLKKMNFWNVISFHDERLSGHLAFFKNLSHINQIPFKHPEWSIHLKNEEYVGFDEYYLSGFLSDRFFTPPRAARFTNKLQPTWLVRIIKKIRFKEEFTTPFTGRPWRDSTLFENQPSEWHWNKGVVYACRDMMKSPYLHLMNFKKSQWNTNRLASWEDESKVSRFEVTEETQEFYISQKGILRTLRDSNNGIC